jgi:multicomponent Na+:H+ antiporter subunit E
MLLGSILLAFAWAALQGEITLANLFIGYALGYVILGLLAKGRVLPSTLTSRTGHAVRLAGFFIHELVLANVRVAIDVIRPQTSIRPAVIAVPLDVTSDAEILLLSMLINITPGSVTIDLSDDRRTLYVHVMHMVSVEASRHDIKTGFERRIKLLFDGSRFTDQEGTDA